MAQLSKMPGGKQQTKRRKNAIKKYLNTTKQSMKGKNHTSNKYLNYNLHRIPKFLKEELKNAA
jgi:hypothetical protein